LDGKPDVPSPPPGHGEVLELTSENYNDVTKKGLHFVKFFAPWCSHCQRLAPIWDELAHSLAYENKVKISKVDCTTNPEICQNMNVKGYPTLLWIKDGEVVSGVV
jgi:thioredoxin domain-containing protein 5